MNSVRHLETATMSRPLNELAFLYVSGDLAADQLEQFERLLDESQAAREAVASACELATLMVAARTWGTPTNNIDASDAMSLVSSTTASRVPRGRLLRWEMAVTTLALLLMLLSGWYQIRARYFHSGNSNHSPYVQANSDLALAWSRTQLDAAAADDELTATLQDSLVNSEVSGDELPTWLLAAVSAHAVKTPDSEAVPPSESTSNSDEEET